MTFEELQRDVARLSPDHRLELYRSCPLVHPLETLLALETSFSSDLRRFCPRCLVAFITFVALNGSGYVRVVKRDTKAAASLMSPTEERFDYVEHVMIGLRSITYYGLRQQ